MLNDNGWPAISRLTAAAEIAGFVKGGGEVIRKPVVAEKRKWVAVIRRHLTKRRPRSAPNEKRAEYCVA